MIQKAIPLADGHLTVDVYGDPEGDPADSLVVLPGVMSDARAWRRFAAALTTWARVIVVNRRGRAPSSELPEGHSLLTEVADLGAVLDAFAARQLFAWSFGGLVALHAANARRLDHVIAYEPVMAPFGEHALPALEAAHEAADWDAAVEIINVDVSGFDADHVAGLRANEHAWRMLEELARPLYPELRAIATASVPAEFGARAHRIDVLIGEDDLGAAPYGTSVADVLSLTPRARTHTVPGQGHMAHLEDPSGLAALVDTLR